MHSVLSNTPSTLAEADQQQHNQLLRGLIRDAAHGDTRAFESLYRLTSRWVLARVRRLTGDSLAEDVMAEVYLQVWRSLAAFDPARGDPMPWLMTIARSRALDRLRSERSSHGGTSYDAHASQPEEASHRDGPSRCWDEDIASALDGQVCPPHPDDAALLERVRVRVMHQLAGHSQASLHKTVRTASAPWQHVAPGVERKLLYESADAVSVLLRLAPGTRMPGHGHAIDEECLVLEGTLKIGADLILHAGDFHVGLKGIPHADASTDTGALVFLREARHPAETIGT